jgi:hypothetical protein
MALLTVLWHLSTTIINFLILNSFAAVKQNNISGNENTLLRIYLPVAPTGPITPVAPVDPTGPIGPVNPVFPTGPTEPVKPVAPTFPVCPVSPNCHQKTYKNAIYRQ